MKRSMFILTLVILTFLFAAVGSVEARSVIFYLHATGANVVGTAGDPDACVEVAIWNQPNTGTMQYEVRITGITFPITSMTINAGNAGENGPVVITFAPVSGENTHIIASVPVSREVLNDLRHNHEHYYFLLSNEEFPSGAVRDQVRRQTSHPS